MPERRRTAPPPVIESAIVRIVEVAGRQWGVVSRAQLLDAGLSTGAIAKWVAANRLHRVLPGVYALGHRGLAIEGRLMAAVLYGGPGAMLSHVTAAWWWRIWGREPDTIHITTFGIWTC